MNSTYCFLLAKKYIGNIKTMLAAMFVCVWVTGSILTEPFSTR